MQISQKLVKKHILKIIPSLLVYNQLPLYAKNERSRIFWNLKHVPEHREGQRFRDMEKAKNVGPLITFKPPIIDKA